VIAALAGVDVAVTVAGVTSDRLYPIELQRELAAFIPGAAEAIEIGSAFGHDGFLLEIEQVGKVVASALR
jgi:homoserine O-acetyltransferase